MAIRQFVIKGPPGKHPKYEETGPASVPGVPGAGLSLYMTRKLRKLLSTLTNPTVMGFAMAFDPRSNQMEYCYLIDATNAYSVSENSDDEFAA